MTKIKIEDLPVPGSKEASTAGCKCPVVDNHYGKGYMDGITDDNGMTLYAIHENCPLHGKGTLYWQIGRDAQSGAI